MEKWFGAVLFLLSYQKLVHGQCFLSIELVQFQNLYSLEIKKDFFGIESFCCCDESGCSYDADEFPLNYCESLCDTYFVLSFTECQDFSPCPVTMITDVTADSNTTTTVNYGFHFGVSSSAINPVVFEIAMRDEAGTSFDDIDTFNIKATFPSDNQEGIFTGNRGIASINLKYDIVCIHEPEACNTTGNSSEVIGANSASIPSPVQVVTVTQVVTVSPEPAASGSDNTLPVWVAVAFLLLVLSTAAVTLAIVMACMVHKKSKYTSTPDPFSSPVQLTPVEKQTAATQESDTGEVTLSGNVSYESVDTKSNRSEESDPGEVTVSGNMSYGRVTMNSNRF